MADFEKALHLIKRAAARGGVRAGAALLDSLAADGQSVLGSFAKEIGVGRSLLRELIPTPEGEVEAADGAPKPKAQRPRKIKVEVVR